jgi:hypothetical protein
MCCIEVAARFDFYPELVYDPGPMAGYTRQNFGRWNENQQKQCEENQVEGDFFPACQH